MEFHYKQYFDLLDTQDQDWIRKTTIYQLSHMRNGIGDYNKLHAEPEMQKQYAQINFKLCKLMKDNIAKHKPHTIDWQADSKYFSGMLDIITQSLKMMELIKTIQNEIKFKRLIKENYGITELVNKKFYLSKTSPQNYNIEQNGIILNGKPAVLIKNCDHQGLQICKKLSAKNDVFVTCNPYIITVEDIGLQFSKDYGIHFTEDEVIKTLLKVRNIKTKFSHNKTKLHIFIKETSDDRIEISLELIDTEELISLSIFIHAIFNNALSQCTHFDKAIMLYDTLEALDIHNDLDTHKDNQKIKLYQIDGTFDFKDFIDLVYYDNQEFTCVINECFKIGVPTNVMNFYGCDITL